MKKVLIITVSVFFSFTLYAQSIALCRDGETQIFRGNAAFTQAYEASQNGDTLYFSGGTFFPPASLNKELTLFGAGHYQDSTLVTGKTIMSGNFKLSQGADNFHIEGFAISGRFEIIGNESITNLTIKRCFITDEISITGNKTNVSTNIAIIGSVFGGGNLENAENVLVSNCIISNGRFVYSYGNSFTNNIILFSNTSFSTHVFSACNNNIISNNIIQREGSYLNYIVSGEGNVLSNNVFSHAEPSMGTNSTLSNNITGVTLSDLFINQAGSAFDYAHNYHLQDETLYVGNDGKQVGIYGGAFPYKEGAVPVNPHIMEINISNTTNEQGELPVKIKVSVQKEND